MTALEQVRALRPHFDEVRVEAGRTIVSEGTLCHQFFVVAEGTLETCRRGVRGELVAGQAFGWAAMRSRGLNDASVRALTDARLLVMGHAQFRAAVDVAGLEVQPDARECVMPAPPASMRRRLTATHIR